MKILLIPVFQLWFQSDNATNFTFQRGIIFQKMGRDQINSFGTPINEKEDPSNSWA